MNNSGIKWGKSIPTSSYLLNSFKHFNWNVTGMNACVLACVCGWHSSFFCVRPQLLCKASHLKYEWRRISSGIFVCLWMRMPKESLISYAFVKMEFRNKIHDNPTKDEERIQIILFIFNHKRFAEKKKILNQTSHFIHLFKRRF